MKFLILFLLLSTSNAFAQKSLNAQAFQANVRPVLSGIINDFYQMISLFPNYPAEIITIMEQFDTIENERESLMSTCPRVLNSKCQQPIDSLRKKLSLIESKTFELMAHQKPSDSLYMTSIIGLRIMSDFQTELYSFKGTLDNSSFLLRSNIKSQKPTFDVIKKLDELQVMVSLAVVEFVPFVYKSDFRNFYFNFVHPVELQMFKRTSYEFLNRNLNSLNFSINLLNQNLTKRNKKTPEGMAPFLSLIHNRWNSLLRYYF
jgi:hypothetical protein